MGVLFEAMIVSFALIAALPIFFLFTVTSLALLASEFIVNVAIYAFSAGLGAIYAMAERIHNGRVPKL